MLNEIKVLYQIALSIKCRIDYFVDISNGTIFIKNTEIIPIELYRFLNKANIKYER